MTRTGDTFVDTTEIAGISNNWGADIFVSIHYNSGGGNGGTETFTTRSYRDFDDDLANRTTVIFTKKVIFRKLVFNLIGNKQQNQLPANVPRSH